MTQKTLYLLQGSYAALEQHIQTLSQVLTTEDSVVLMGDAVLKHQHTVLLQYAHCYVLEQDLALLGDVAHKLTTLNYAQFADLVLAHSRHISLK